MTSATTPRAWFPFGTADDCELRLLCLPHAGAGASVFARWLRAMAPEIGVCPVQLPGRETRLGEAPYRQVDALVPDFVSALTAELDDRPYAVYGHSMGALIAFETARLMRARGLPGPVHLFVSGRTAPQSAPPGGPPVHTLPTSQLVAWLRELGGTPDEVLGDPTLWELLLPLLRADIAVNEDYRYAQQAPLEAPLTVLGGVSDRRVSPPRLSEWQEQTSSAFRLRLLPGAHFAPLERQEETLACIEGDLLQRL